MVGFHWKKLFNVGILPLSLLGVSTYLRHSSSEIHANTSSNKLPSDSAPVLGCFEAHTVNRGLHFLELDLILLPYCFDVFEDLRDLLHHVFLTLQCAPLILPGVDALKST